MMRKIGLITFTYGDNYGQRLQNLAVQQILEQKGFEAFTFRQKQRFTISTKIKKPLKTLLSGRCRESIVRHQSFQDFDKRFIRFYEDYISPTHIPHGIEDFDYFVAGSDQIWNPNALDDVNSTMFLTFTPEKKRIALSPSISSPSIPDDMHDDYVRYFNGFARLSVREYQGANLIKDLTGRDAEVLIDPTLYFDSDYWREYAEKPSFDIPKNYLLTYFLGKGMYDNQINSICNDLSLQKIDLMVSSPYYSLGPSEFLWLIAHASAVATDSYHGTIFSLLFNRPVFHCPRLGSTVDMGSRFETLYKKMGITQNLVNEYVKGCNSQGKLRDIEPCLAEERHMFDHYLDACFHD